ncbi:MAG: hypothetical protein ABJ382_18620 [Ilumatobacter sp.]
MDLSTVRSTETVGDALALVTGALIAGALSATGVSATGVASPDAVVPQPTSSTAATTVTGRKTLMVALTPNQVEEFPNIDTNAMTDR